MACPPGARLFHFHYPEVGPGQKGKIQIVRSEESSPRGRDSLGNRVVLWECAVHWKSLEDPLTSHGAPHWRAGSSDLERRVGESPEEPWLPG